ncbi:MAG TPA: alpha/beta hydrolase [Methylomirabilota bacterium]|nr:alpha/beta hydrolase [Methylomirabilota bacterium]
MRQLYLDDLDTPLCYHDLPGRLPARVFLHGLGCASSADFADIAAHPRLRDHRSLLVDLLGFGFSGRPASFGYSLVDHADIAARLLDHLRLTGSDVVGHSMGGSIAAVLADRRPDLVGRLVVAEGNLDPGGGSLSRPIAAQAEADYVAGGHATVMAAVASFGRNRNGPAAFSTRFQVAAPVAVHRSARSLLAMPTPTVREILARLSIPRTYLYGDRGEPGADLPGLAIAGVALVVIPDAGHDLMSDNPDAFAAAVATAFGS